VGATGRDRADRVSRAGANGFGDARANPRAADAKAGAAKAAGAKAESPRKGPRRDPPTKGHRAKEARTARAQRANDPGGDGGAHSPEPGLPRGPQALPREQVATHQRERLYKAMVECVEEHGYVATTISELVARARISRRSFYDHFHNKDECLLATYDTVIERLGRRLRESHDPAASWEEQLETFIRTLFDAAGDRPDAARLVCVEMGAAGPIGVRRWAEGAERLQRYIVAGFARADGPGTVPDPVARAIVGAVRRILYTRVERARSSKSLRADLAGLVPDLLAWIACYYPSPEGLPLRPRRVRCASEEGARLGGRAPGTLSARPLSGERGLPRGEHNLPRGFVTHNQRERIFDAIANLTAARGYPALSLDEVAAEAAVSLQTFYAHFAGKEDAFVATYETGHARAMAVINQTLARQKSWTRAVRAGAAALLELLAGEPSYAHVACVDVMIAYPHMAQRAQQANDFYAGLLDLRRARDAPSLLPSPVVGEAIVGGVFELLHDYVLRGQTHRLPELAEHVVYIALAPFMGAEGAWAIAKG
jgi:AcrR family transcriptional regulator